MGLPAPPPGYGADSNVDAIPSPPPGYGPNLPPPPPGYGIDLPVPPVSPAQPPTRPPIQSTPPIIGPKPVPAAHPWGPIGQAAQFGLDVGKGLGTGIGQFVTGTFTGARDLVGEGVMLAHAIWDPKAQTQVANQAENVGHFLRYADYFATHPNEAARAAGMLSQEAWKNIVKDYTAHPGETIGNAAAQVLLTLGPGAVGWLGRGGRFAEAPGIGRAVAEVVRAAQAEGATSMETAARGIGAAAQAAPAGMAAGAAVGERLDQAMDFDRGLKTNDLLTGERFLTEVKRVTEPQWRDITHAIQTENLNALDPALRGVADNLRPYLDDIKRVYAKLRGVNVDELGDQDWWLPRNAIRHQLPFAGVLTTKWTKTASFLRNRRMMALDDGAGQRMVASLDRDGHVRGWINNVATDLGTQAAHLTGDVFTDATGKPWRLVQATDREIEAHTPVRYYPNAGFNVVSTWLRAREIERATDLLETLKRDPAFAKVGVKIEGIGGIAREEAPPDWVPTKLRQFTGWRFEPKVAAVLDKYSGAYQRELAPNVLDNLNRLLVGAIFVNPFTHIPNLSVNWAVAGGVSRWTHPILTAKTFARAFNQAIHLGPDYVDMTLQGMKGMREATHTREFWGRVIDGVRREVETDGAVRDSLARTLGRGSVNLLTFLPRKLVQLNNFITWLADDTLRMQFVYELEAKGLPRAEAIAKADKVLADYRLPAYLHMPTFTGRQGEEAGILAGRLLNNRVFLMFNAYHVSLLRALRNTTLTPGRMPADLRDAADRLAMLGLVYFAGIPALGAAAREVLMPHARAQIAQAKTPEEKMRATQTLERTQRLAFRPAGLARPVDLAERLARGEATLGEATQAFLTPSPITRTGIALVTGIDPTFRTPVRGFGDYLRLAFAPYSTYSEVASGRYTPATAAAQWGGFQAPTMLPAEAKVHVTWDAKGGRRDQRVSEIHKAQINGQNAQALQLAIKARDEYASDVRRMIDEQARRGLPMSNAPGARSWATTTPQQRAAMAVRIANARFARTGPNAVLLTPLEVARLRATIMRSSDVPLPTKQRSVPLPQSAPAPPAQIPPPPPGYGMDIPAPPPGYR